MARVKRHRCESGIYHIVSRGVGRQLIFEDDADRFKFLKLLRDALQGGLSLYAWCLMDNHIHLLVHGQVDEISSAMGKLLGAYAQYFNSRYGRVGHLFQNRFDSECVEDDTYLLTVVRYIHQNPVKAKIAPSCVYRWSSYSEYCGTAWLCDTELVLGILGGRCEFVIFHDAISSNSCLEAKGDNFKKRSMPDSEAMLIAREIVGGDDVSSVAGLVRSERDIQLRRMKQKGLSVRQIERITGVPKSIVQRA